MPKTVTLYTSPGCPDCAALKAWFAQLGVADRVKAELGVRVAPITVCDAQVLYGTAREQIPQLRKILGVDR
ncbi:MAG: glutaredoxin family protein [Acidiferrobacter sp.]